MSLYYFTRLIIEELYNKHKTCNRCIFSKNKTSFNTVTKNQDNLSNTCRKCINYDKKNKVKLRLLDTYRGFLIEKIIKQWNENLSNALKDYKYCPKCQILVKKSNFSIASSSKDLLGSRCKKCCNKDFQESRIKLNDRDSVIIPDIQKCFRCLIDKENTLFHKHKGKKNGLSDWCIKCEKSEMINFKLEMKKQLGGICNHCGMNDLKLLQFDHLENHEKSFNISQSRNKKEITEEVKKCQLLCPNCHYIKSNIQANERRKEYSELKRPKDRDIRDKLRIWINKIKFDLKKCETCDFKVSNESITCFHFDHIEPKDKLYEISVMIKGCYSINSINKELLKTRMLCANCHYTHTAKQFDWYNSLK